MLQKHRDYIPTAAFGVLANKLKFLVLPPYATNIGLMEMKIDALILEKFVNTAVDGFDPNENYTASYPNILNASKILLNHMGPQAIPAISFLAYGWMPTILNYNICPENNEKIFSGSKVKGASQACSFVESVENSPINNSWVGLSKVLHFINPDNFPIWDRRIARHFNLSSSYQMSKRENYLSYLRFIHANLDHPFLQDRKLKLRKIFGYDATLIRIIEFSLFVNSKK